MKRVALHTLGCKLNAAETATIGRQFLERGFQVVEIDEQADVCVINTCTVTERADRECRQIVRRALRHSPGAYVAVVGCYAQLQPETIAAIEGVDLVLGTQEKFDLFRYTADFRKQPQTRIVVSPIEQIETFRAASSADASDRTRAFLKIQDGCDYTCSFCTIPRARGESRSVSIEEIVSQAQTIVRDGYKEIVLTGVNVGDYGKKIGTNLLSLLRALVSLQDLERIRISSIEPNLLTDEVLDFWLSTEKLCKHFHLPLQSGTNHLLKQMRRRYGKEWYAKRVERIKSALPDAAIGADVIVGFPGETDSLFEATYQFLNELPVSYLHVFTYSQRPHTPAASYPNQVEPRIRFERSERLRNLSVKKRRAFYESFLGKTVDVLFESELRRGTQTGLTSQYVRVHVPWQHNLTNRILPVRVTAVNPDACTGYLVQEAPNGQEARRVAGEAA
jgi:threonylcarbamoyladenosine tRNA methylthiotransferase MtaB